MTREEKELKVLELFGLKVGDKIRIKKPKHFYLESKILKIAKSKDGHEDFIGFDDGGITLISVDILFKEDWQKIESSLKDKRCDDFEDCKGCPFYNKSIINCVVIEDYEKKTLEEKYNEIKKELDELKTEIFGEEEK